MTFKKKRKVYTSNVCFILQLAVGLGWENGRVGRESLFAIGTGGNLREKTKQKQTAKKKPKKQNKTLYTHYKCSSVCICGNSDEPGK